MKVLFLILTTSLIFISCNKRHHHNYLTENILIHKDDSHSQKNKLPIPPLLEHTEQKNGKKYYKLSVQKGTTEFFKGTPVMTYGYKGSLLGPTIKAKRGDKVTIQVKNKLREYTTVHWHGMLVPSNMDGGPHQVIQPDGQWTASFTINQPAATAWYHPHGLGNTAIQVYKGLAGLFIVEDEVSEALDIPKTYGVDDIPLIVQDKRFTDDGLPLYITHMRDIMEGMKGNTILVNGVANPFLKVKRTLYRFRLLNGSNARTYTFRLTDSKAFHVIASDAGLLEKPVKMTTLKLSPGERAEILIDFSSYSAGEKLSLESEYFTIVDFETEGSSAIVKSIPEKLTSIERLKISKVTGNRRFNLEGMGHHVSINRRQMNINRIDEYMKLNTTETWTITSSTHGMMGMGGMGRMRGMHGMAGILHNFHAHGVHFQILERDGRPPLPHEQGWKDTMFIDEGESVKVITRYLYKGVFMYHCHILEHEDNGMMGQFEVK